MSLSTNMDRFQDSFSRDQSTPIGNWEPLIKSECAVCHIAPEVNDLWTKLRVGEVELEGHSDCIKRVKVVGSTWSVL